MPPNDTPADPLDGLAFEIERFEWAGEDRLELVGRWFGVRGRRFIRPTLHARLGDRRRRLIALLDDKPWSPDAEGPWTAAFAWRGQHEGISSVRLEVAPDVILDLPAPGATAPGTTLNPRPKPRRETPKPKPAEPAKPAAKVAAAPPPASPEATPAAPPPPPSPEATRAAAPPPASPEAAPPAGPDVATLALQRRLAEERSAREGLAAELAQERDARERLVAELAAAQEQVAALATHQASAVERAQDVVRLEGELAAARQELAARDREKAAAAPPADLERELEATRDELAAAQAPLEVAPLERRLPISPRSDWAQGTRAAVVAALVVLFVLFALVVLSVI